MKIAYFTDTYHPQYNGVVTSIDAFKEELEKRGHEIYIFCPKVGNEPKGKRIYPIKSYDFKPYPAIRIGVPSPWIYKKIKEINPDLIHIQSPAPIGIAGLIVAKKLKIPTITTYHTMFSDYAHYIPILNFFKGTDRKVIDKLMVLFHNMIDLVISPTERVKRFLKTIKIKKRIVVLPTGIKIPKQKFKKIKTKPYFIHVGRLAVDKNIQLVVNAFNKIRKKHDVNLIITSTGPYEDDLKILAKDLGIEDRIKFLGFVPEKERNNLYHNALALVFASDTDTQGLVQYEAMSCGCPVILAAPTAISEKIEHNKNGLLFRKNDVEDLEDTMDRLIRSKKLRETLVKNGFKVAQEMDIKNMTDKLEKLYVRSREKISIIIPTYMEEKYIEKTLKSIKKQEYENYEIIVVDSNSTDKTREIAKRYADKVYNIKKRGVSLARNYGARKAKNEILIFLDGDMILKPYFLDYIRRNFMKKKVSAVSGYVKCNGNLIEKFIYRATSIISWLSTIINYPMFYGMCIACRKKDFTKIGGFNEKLVISEDYDLSLRLNKLKNNKPGSCVVEKRAITITSPRRLRKMGHLNAILFHLKCVLSYSIFKNPIKEYPVVR